MTTTKINNKKVEQFSKSAKIMKAELEKLAWQELVEDQKIDKTYQAKLQAKYDALQNAITAIIAEEAEKIEVFDGED